jgi:hypothetical protein
MTAVAGVQRSLCGVTVGATIAAWFVLGGLDVPVASAAGGGQDLNGTYIAQSNGDWAQTNDRYQDEATIRSRWTITSTCSTALDCTGRVSSDAGWSSDVVTDSGSWYVKRNIDNWEPCPDGSFAPGLQVTRFYPVGADGMMDAASTTYAGIDMTTSPSGSCGRSKSLVISMPFRLEKISVTS